MEQIVHDPGTNHPNTFQPFRWLSVPIYGYSSFKLRKKSLEFSFYLSLFGKPTVIHSKNNQRDLMRFSSKKSNKQRTGRGELHQQGADEWHTGEKNGKGFQAD